MSGDPINEDDVMLWVLQQKANENAAVGERLQHYMNEDKKKIKRLEDRIWELERYEHAVLTLKDAMFGLHELDKGEHI